MWFFQHRRRIESLETAVEGLRKLPKELAIQWEDHLDKLGRVMARMNQRARQEALHEPKNDDPVPDNPEVAEPVSRVGEHDLLTQARNRRFGGRH